MVILWMTFVTGFVGVACSVKFWKALVVWVLTSIASGTDEFETTR